MLGCHLSWFLNQLFLWTSWLWVLLLNGKCLQSWWQFVIVAEEVESRNQVLCVTVLSQWIISSTRVYIWAFHGWVHHRSPSRCWFIWGRCRKIMVERVNDLFSKLWVHEKCGRRISFTSKGLSSREVLTNLFFYERLTYIRPG